MVRFILAVFFLYLSTELIAQPIVLGDAYTLALSGAVLASKGNMIFNQNPASAVYSSSDQISISHQNRYLIPELNVSMISGHIHTKDGVVHPGLFYFGDSRYSQSTLSLAYGHALSENFSGGVRFTYGLNHVEVLNEYSSTIAATAGILWDIAGKTSFAIIYSNAPNDAAIFPESITRVSIWKAGLASQEQDKYMAAIQFELLNHTDFILAAGYEFWFNRVIGFRSGIRLGSYSTYSFGFGTHLHKLALHIGFEQHINLGLTASVGCSYLFNRNE